MRFHSHERLVRISLLLLLLSCAFTASSRQRDSLHFIRLGIEDGLPDAKVTSIIQDAKGYLWIGTANGLSRYDGTEFRNFFHSNQPNSLPNNDINEIVNYDSAHLLICTARGLSLLNIYTLEFRNFLVRSSAVMFSRDNFIRTAAVDRKKNIWAGSRTALYYLSPDLKILKTFRGYTEADYNTLRMLYVYDIIVLPGDDVLLRLENGATDGTDYRIYNENADTLQPLEHLPHHPLHFVYNYGSGHLRADDQGKIHFLKVFSDTLCTYDVPNQKLYHSRLNLNNYTPLRRQASMNTRILNADPDMLLCALEAEGGMVRLPDDFPTNRAITHLPVYFRGVTVYCAKQDRDGNLWVGCGNGLFKSVSRFKNVLSTYTTAGENPALDLTHISFIGDSVWVASDPVGFFIFDKALKQIDQLPMKQEYLLNNTWRVMPTASKDTLWLHTQAGLRWYHLRNGSYGKINVPGKPMALDQQPTTAGFTDSKGLIWLGIGFGNGVVQYNPATRIMQHYPASKGSNCLPIRYPLSITEDHETNLWMGNHDGVGLVRWVRSQNRFELITPDYYSTFDNALITALLSNGKQQLWIGTLNGLLQYNIPTKTFTKFDVSSGLPSNAISAITEDDRGRLWIGTSNGLSCFFPKQRRFVNFVHPSALPEPGINDVAFDPRSKKVFFITYHFVNAFSPDDLLAQFPVLNLEITGVHIGNKEQPLQSFYSIPYNRNDLSFSFTAINFANGTLNKYYYKLEGKEWISLGTQRQVNFLNLSPGSYSFSLKAVNSAGVWSHETTLGFTILRPWWQTWWFRIAAAVAIVGFILLVVKRRIRNIRDKAEFRQKIAETEMMAMRAQMNPHFIFNCINSIDALILSNDKYHATIYLNKFARLLRNILDSSRQNTVPLTKDLETLQLYIDLEKLRDENKFTVLINTDEALLMDDYKVPPLIVQPYVENAILHGLKHRRDNKGQLTITVSKQQDYIEYLIEDNGVGRQASKNGLRKDASYGMQMSGERVKYFNHEETASVIVTDLQEQGQPTGTRVQVLLKMQ